MLVKSFSWGATSSIGWSQEGEKWLGFYPWLWPAEKGWIYRLGVSCVPDSCCKWAWAQCAWSLQGPCGQGGSCARADLLLDASWDLPSCPTRNPSQLPKAGVLWKSDGWWLPKARSHVHRGTGREGGVLPWRRFYRATEADFLRAPAAGPHSWAGTMPSWQVGWSVGSQKVTYVHKRHLLKADVASQE